MRTEPVSAPSTEPEHIAISKSKGIKIDWKDQHHSQYPLAYLRDECPCATCTEPQKSNYSGSELFPMYKPVLRMLDVEPIGSYAVRISWSDGHNTGIYSFDHFRRICPCDQCRASRAA
jgi:DUF971 family protein